MNARTPVAQSSQLILIGLSLIAVWLILGNATIVAGLFRNAGFLIANRQTAVAGDESHFTAGGLNQLHRATQLDPEAASAWRRLGYAYLAAGDEDGAIAAWINAGAMVDELVNAGRIAEQDGRIESAASWYRYASQVMPEDPSGWLHHGLVLEQRGDWAAAQAVYEQGVAGQGLVAPPNGDLLYRLARAHQQTGTQPDWDTIRDLTARAIAGDAFLEEWNRVQAHYLHGEALRSLGFPAEARAEYYWVLTRRPDDYWTRLRLAGIAWQVDRDADTAKAFIDEALALAPDSKWAYLQLAQLLDQQGKEAEAQTVYEHVLRLDPDDRTATNWLADR